MYFSSQKTEIDGIISFKQCECMLLWLYNLQNVTCNMVKTKELNGKIVIMKDKKLESETD